MGKKLFNLFFTVVALFCFASANAQDVSDPQVVLDEHFDAFTEGSVDEPVTTKDISGYSGKLKTELGWTSGRYVYEAGGALMVGDGGNLQTSYLNLSSNGGTVRITVDIKMRDSYGGGVKVSMGYSANETKYCTDSEWHTYSFIFSGGNSSAYIKVEPVMCASGILVDNLKVETGTGFIAAPKVQQPTKATKTSFTASWIGVKGATGYLLDVYSKNGSEKDYLLKDQAVTGSSTSNYLPNTYEVTGLDETKTYYYTMRSVKGENVSEESEEIEVIPVITSVDTPVATEATDVTAAGFTANWNAVADATGYSVKVTRNSVLAEDGDVSILSEDFSGVTKGSLTSVEYPSTRESLDAYTSTKGWEGYMHCLAAGYMGISPYGSAGTVTTPKLDLSANEGKFTLKLTAGAYYYGTMKADECKVIVIDKAGNQAENTVALEAAFKEYVLELTGGDEATAIQISYGGSNKFFIDEMSIVQTLKAGSVKSDVVALSDVGNITSKTYELPLDANTSYEYQVAAYARTIVSGEEGNVYSAYSDAITVEAPVPGTLTADPKEINLWGFTTASESYYNTHKAIFHVEAENCTENITYVMKSSGKAKGSTSPRITVATSGLYEANSGNLNVTCSSSKAVDISDVVVIKSGDAEENVTVNVKVAATQFNGEGIFDEEWPECRPFTVADVNAIHAVMPQNTTWGTDPTHEFSMHFPKLRYFQGVVSEVAADADGKVTFTIVDEEGDAPAVKVVDAKYKADQTALKAGDKVILSGDFGDVEGELQILTADIESIEPAPVPTLTADPKEINLWGFTPTTESYYNTHKAIFHVEAENCTEKITYVMQSSGKAKGSTSPRITVATSGLYEANSGNLNVTCSSSKVGEVSDVVVIKSGEAEENVTVNVKVAGTQYNGEGIFDEEWPECRPFTVADVNAIHAVMPQNTTWGTDPTHEFSMYFPKLRYFQGVVSEVAADADGKVTFTIVDEEGDAPAVKVVDAKYKADQTALKAGDKVILSGDFGDVDGELQILTADIESVETTDAIRNANADNSNGAIYNIRGQKVDENYRGIVVKNGVKVLKK